MAPIPTAGPAARHLVRRADDAQFAVPAWATKSSGFARWSIVDEAGPAVHTGFGICSLEPGGYVPAHVHSYEECFFVLDGEAVLRTAEGARLLRAGDYGVVPVGVTHAWQTHGGAARWADMLAPQPRARFADDTLDDDTVAVPDAAAGGAAPDAASPVDPRDPRTRRFGHIAPSNMDVLAQRQELLATSASMRTALLVYSGITVKMMVDAELGAHLTTMFMVQYDADGVAGAHDHPFEETYLFLAGRAEAVFDGERHELGPGDVAFAGVGCVHAFRNLGAGPLRWLETQAPQPPARHSYRFRRDWDHLRAMPNPPAGK